MGMPGCGSEWCRRRPAAAGTAGAGAAAGAARPRLAPTLAVWHWGLPSLPPRTAEGLTRGQPGCSIARARCSGTGSPLHALRRLGVMHRPSSVLGALLCSVPLGVAAVLLFQAACRRDCYQAAPALVLQGAGLLWTSSSARWPPSEERPMRLLSIAMTSGSLLGPPGCRGPAAGRPSPMGRGAQEHERTWGRLPNVYRSVNASGLPDGQMGCPATLAAAAHRHCRRRRPAAKPPACTPLQARPHDGPAAARPPHPL